MQPKIIVILIIAVLLLIILFQNLGEITFHLLFWQINFSFFLIILITFILGLIVGWLLRSSSAKRKLAKSQIKNQPTQAK